MSKCTLVTAFFPIRSKFPSEQYMTWARTFMSLESPIVLFTIPSLVNVFQEMRGNRPICIIDVEFDNLYMWRTYSDKWIAHHSLDHESFRHTPELYAIWAQKAVFVDDAIKLNPFNTDYFFWCDIGAFRDGIDETVRRTFPSIQHLPQDKIALCSVEQLHTKDWEICGGIPGNFQYKDRIVGGLWGGGRAGCERWLEAYENMLKIYFENDRFAGKDQSVMLSAYLNDTSFATVYRPPSNYDWFYFTRLHSDLGILPQINETYMR